MLVFGLRCWSFLFYYSSELNCFCFRVRVSTRRATVSLAPEACRLSAAARWPDSALIRTVRTSDEVFYLKNKQKNLSRSNKWKYFKNQQLPAVFVFAGISRPLGLQRLKRPGPSGAAESGNFLPGSPADPVCRTAPSTGRKGECLQEQDMIFSVWVKLFVFFQYNFLLKIMKA